MKLNNKFWVITALMTLCCASALAQYTDVKGHTLAFPTAEGFGKYATGGRGGTVVEVTNLDDSGTGSFRWALTENGSKNIIVVFRVSGLISLQSDIRATLTNVTIAGQTAPGDGILYRGGKLNLGGSKNIIIRNLRGRIGLRGDTAFIAGGSIGIENGENIMIDHCCFGWSGEENMTIYDDHFMTVQWCIIHEGLYDAGHAKGSRSYGSQWGGSPASYHHNLLAHNYNRSPRINGANGKTLTQDKRVFLEYFNNVNYNWGKVNSCYGGENEAGNGSKHECDFINNYYKNGPSSPSGSYFMELSGARTGYTMAGPSRWFFSGNVMTGNSAATSNNWSAIHNNTGYTVEQLKSDTMIVPTEFFPLAYSYDYNDYKTSYETAEEAYASVLAKSGTMNRDTVERRIVRETKEGKAQYVASMGKYGFIDSPADAEDWPSYAAATASADTDHDGMPDDWEKAHGLDPNTIDGSKVVSSKGYTALDVYLDELMGEKIEFDLTGVKTASNSGKAVSRVDVYNEAGALIASGKDFNRASLRHGVYVVKTVYTDLSCNSKKIAVDK